MFAKGRIKREIFEGNFFNLVRNLRVGRGFRYKGTVPESEVEEENGDIITPLPEIAEEEEPEAPEALIDDPDADLDVDADDSDSNN